MQGLSSETVAVPWVVKYRTFRNPRRTIRRRFPSEPRARAFYRKLWKRREPPLSQAVDFEKRA